jgi:hypothetical protein
MPESPLRRARFGDTNREEIGMSPTIIPAEPGYQLVGVTYEDEGPYALDLTPLIAWAVHYEDGRRLYAEPIGWPPHPDHALQIVMFPDGRFVGRSGYVFKDEAAVMQAILDRRKALAAIEAAKDVGEGRKLKSV